MTTVHAEALVWWLLLSLASRQSSLGWKEQEEGSEEGKNIQYSSTTLQIFTNESVLGSQWAE